MNSIFKEKRNIIATAFIAFYTVMLILDIDFRLPFFQNIRYTVNALITYLLPLIPPILVLIFLFSLDKEYQLKKWLLPIAFGLKIIGAFISLCSSFASINYFISSPLYTIIFLCSCLTFIAIVFMFIGTLFDFKYINLLKYGALSCAVLFIAVLIIDFIAAGGFAYLKSVPAGVSAINFVALIRAFSGILFYIGIFIVSKESFRR